LIPDRFGVKDIREGDQSPDIQYVFINRNLTQFADSLQVNNGFRRRLAASQSVDNLSATGQNDRRRSFLAFNFYRLVQIFGF